MKTYLFNTSILTAHGTFRYTPITLDHARELAQLSYGSTHPGFTDDDRQIGMGPLVSAIGHESTAQILTTLLGVPVEVSRIQAGQEVGDLAIVMKLRGRPPEGKILTRDEVEAIGYEFGLIERTE